MSAALVRMLLGPMVRRASRVAIGVVTARKPTSACKHNPAVHISMRVDQFVWHTVWAVSPPTRSIGFQSKVFNPESFGRQNVLDSLNVDAILIECTLHHSFVQAFDCELTVPQHFCQHHSWSTSALTQHTQ
jgi:hypothetical protein